MNQDDVDTAPIVGKEAAIEHRSAITEAGQVVEIVLEPERPMRDPLLFASTNPRGAKIALVRIAHGEDIVNDSPEPAAHLRFGLVLKGIVSREKAIKIFFENQDVCQVRIGASLVASDKE